LFTGFGSPELEFRSRLRELRPGARPEPRVIENRQSRHHHLALDRLIPDPLETLVRIQTPRDSSVAADRRDPLGCLRQVVQIAERDLDCEPEVGLGHPEQ
jgi:hypothetical protein